MSELITIHAFVSGRVQGVFYRDTVRRIANQHHITGWVKNLPDGRVELIATAPQPTIETFVAWLWQGSPASKVTAVDWEMRTLEQFSNFTVRRH